jgi:hypothetical protein
VEVSDEAEHSMYSQQQRRLRNTGKRASVRAVSDSEEEEEEVRKASLLYSDDEAEECGQGIDLTHLPSNLPPAEEEGDASEGDDDGEHSGDSYLDGIFDGDLSQSSVNSACEDERPIPPPSSSSSSSSSSALGGNILRTVATNLRASSRSSGKSGKLLSVDEQIRDFFRTHEELLATVLNFQMVKLGTVQEALRGMSCDLFY